jgi:hypothetical protein
MFVMPRFFEIEELDMLAIGAWILGTGGGGSPYASHLVARHRPGGSTPSNPPEPHPQAAADGQAS